MVSPSGSWSCGTKWWRDGVLHDVNGGGQPAELPDRRDSSSWVAVHTLVGRDEPLGRLRAALDSALAGRGGVVLVAGEPGIGKTAVLGALADGRGRPVGGRGVGSVLGRLDGPTVLAVDTGAA